MIRHSTYYARLFKALTKAEPDMPEGVTDRAADVWEALLAIRRVPRWVARAG